MNPTFTVEELLSQCVRVESCLILGNRRTQTKNPRTGERDYLYRVVWEKHKGPIPIGMEVLHKCDSPPCNEINHLVLGTQADNMADMDSKGRRNHHTGEGSSPRKCQHGIYGHGCGTRHVCRHGIQAHNCGTKKRYTNADKTA